MKSINKKSFLTVLTSLRVTLLFVYNSYFPHLVILTYVLLLVESISYPGFIFKTLFIPVGTLLIITILSFLLFQFFGEKKNGSNTFYYYFMNLNQTLTLPLIILFYILNSLEYFNFPNYVFSTYHLHLSVLEKIVILNLVLSIFSINSVISKLVPKQIKSRFSLSNSLEIFFILSVVWIFIIHSWSFVKYLNRSIVSYSSSIGQSKAEKLVWQLGGDDLSGWVYTYGEFVKRHTPDDAMIIIPPQKESWQMEGNPWYFRWFVYPRTLLSTQQIVQPFPEDGEYILIAHGAWVWGVTEYVWPRVTIPAEEIESMTFIDRVTQQETTVTGVGYVPNQQETWGIIQLKR